MPYVPQDIPAAGTDGTAMEEFLRQLDENVDAVEKLAQGFAVTTYGADQVLTGSSGGQPTGLSLTTGGMPSGSGSDVVNTPVGEKGEYLTIENGTLRYEAIPAVPAGAQHIIGVA